jgi:hypothetical protein
MSALLQTAAKFGASGLLFAILIYVIKRYIIEPQNDRIQELEQDKKELSNRLMETRKNMWSQENDKLQSRVNELKKRMDELRNDTKS